MAKKKQGNDIADDAVIGVDAPAQPDTDKAIDGESAVVDTEKESSGVQAAAAAADVPAGLNPGSGGAYRLIDGKMVRE